MAKFEKGKSGNPNTQFSSTYQPKNRGRKKKILKQLQEAEDAGEEYKLTSKEAKDHLVFLLTREVPELKAIHDDPETPWHVLAIVRAMIKSAKKGTLAEVLDLYHEVYGRPTQRIEKMEIPNEIEVELEIE